MSYGIAVIAAVGLAVLPGAWLGFTVPDRRVPWQVKLAFSVALSPAVLAVEIVLFSLGGQPFSLAVYIVGLLNLFALGVIAFDVRRVGTPAPDAGSPADLLAALGCFALLVFILLATWLGIPNYRVYTWHNMMQIDACYQIVELPAIPQDWDLAGVRLNYGWFGLVQLTSISWLMDCPPTLVFPWLNALQLLALVVLMYETARQFGGASPCCDCFDNRDHLTLHECRRYRERSGSRSTILSRRNGARVPLSRNTAESTQWISGSAS